MAVADEDLALAIVMMAGCGLRHGEARAVNLNNVVAHDVHRVREQIHSNTLKPAKLKHRRLGLGRTETPRPPATYHRTHGVRDLHGCYSVGDDTLGGVNGRKKGAANTLAALKSIRAARPDGAPVYVILDNLSAHESTDIRRWATSTRSSCASPRPTPLGPTPSRPTSDR